MHRRRHRRRLRLDPARPPAATPPRLRRRRRLRRGERASENVGDVEEVKQNEEVLRKIALARSHLPAPICQRPMLALGGWRARLPPGKRTCSSVPPCGLRHWSCAKRSHGDQHSLLRLFTTNGGELQNGQWWFMYKASRTSALRARCASCPRRRFATRTTGQTRAAAKAARGEWLGVRRDRRRRGKRRPRLQRIPGHLHQVV